MYNCLLGSRYSGIKVVVVTAQVPQCSLSLVLHPWVSCVHTSQQQLHPQLDKLNRGVQPHKCERWQQTRCACSPRSLGYLRSQVCCSGHDVTNGKTPCSLHGSHCCVFAHRLQVTMCVASESNLGRIIGNHWYLYDQSVSIVGYNHFCILWHPQTEGCQGGACLLLCLWCREV